MRVLAAGVSAILFAFLMKPAFVWGWTLSTERWFVAKSPEMGGLSAIIGLGVGVVFVGLLLFGLLMSFQIAAQLWLVIFPEAESKVEPDAEA